MRGPGWRMLRLLLVAAVGLAACGTGSQATSIDASSASDVSIPSPDEPSPDEPDEAPSDDAGDPAPEAPEADRSSAIEISPEDDAVEVVGSHPAGTAFRFTEGIHRIDVIVPRDGDTFIGDRGAVLSGAVVLDRFEVRDSRWVMGGLEYERDPAGFCADGFERCVHPEDLFVDDEPLRHVASIDEVGEGTWFFDYDTDEVHLGSDPTDRLVELSVVRQAFTGSAVGVTIEDLTIEKFAPPGQTAAVHARDGLDWTIRGNTVRLNHAVGVYAGPGTVVSCNSLVDNGQHGITAKGADVLVERNTISRNNYARFAMGWSAGGAKFVETTDLVVRDNVVVGNIGPGLWTDVGAIDTLYAGNVVIGNRGPGIFHEISYAAVIRDNVVMDNGSPDAGWVWGAGIQLANVSDVEVTGNLLEGNQQGIIGTHQDRGEQYPLRSIDVHDNVVRDSGRTGVSQSIGDQSVYDADLVFRSNHYEGDVIWGWLDSARTWEQWQGFGHDLDGSYEPEPDEAFDLAALAAPAAGCPDPDG